jgi:2-dehydro-3-deoxyphosphogluconate aldolase/(4S)-4-hydroxy-2-oxoglutarate aldolase
MALTIDSLIQSRIVAIVRLEHYDQAVPLAEALLEGGISAIEFTLTGSGALDAIGKTRAALGATAQIGDLLAPLPHLKLIPTGGIDAANARAYLDAGAVAVGIGGSLIPVQAVFDQDWAQITAAASKCVAAIA